MSRPLTPLEQACLAAYDAICVLVPHNLRHTVILAGSAASLAHGFLGWKARDADILVGVEALGILCEAIDKRQGGLHRDGDLSVRWDMVNSEGDKLFEVKLDLVELGGWTCPRIPDVVGFGEGYVVTLTELVRLRGDSLINRGEWKDHISFHGLLSLAVKRKAKLPPLGEEEMKLMISAVEECELSRGTVEMFMEVLGRFEEGGVWFENWVAWAQYHSL